MHMGLPGKHVRILKMDKTYTPDGWISVEDALSLINRGIVLSHLGDTAFVLRGGINAMTGKQSLLEVGSIIAVDTKHYHVSDMAFAPFSSELVFVRDKHICAYCGAKFSTHKLTMDHIIPASKGGATDWMNIVTACEHCNQKKANRTPQQAGMELLYVPYKPNRFEYLILSNRNILADQMEFLMSRVPKNSRLFN